MDTDRKKNQNDPIANPIYFFSQPGNEKKVKLLSLETFNRKLKEIVITRLTKKINRIRYWVILIFFPVSIQNIKIKFLLYQCALYALT